MWQKWEWAVRGGAPWEPPRAWPEPRAGTASFSPCVKKTKIPLGLTPTTPPRGRGSWVIQDRERREHSL